TLRREPVLLSAVVEQAVEMIRASIDSRAHAFTVSLPPEPIRLDADPARLAQVVGNLLSNATKYTPRGGSIWLTAERTGGGFVVQLPVPQDAPPERRPARVRQPHASAGDRLRVLIVEDNQDAAESLAMMLELWGHAVETASDGLAALELVARREPDVVLSDLGLPGMDGYELARRLRQRPGLQDAVLVALSGYGRDEDKCRALDAGFDHHLVKPPDLDVLAELLGRIAGRPDEPPRAVS